LILESTEILARIFFTALTPLVEMMKIYPARGDTGRATRGPQRGPRRENDPQFVWIRKKSPGKKIDQI
jgi:hypothetical protein